MKVKMLEHYKDSTCTLIQGDEVEVSGKLGAWLLEHRKAEKITQPEIVVEVKEPETIVEPIYKSKRGRQ